MTSVPEELVDLVVGIMVRIAVELVGLTVVELELVVVLEAGLDEVIDVLGDGVFIETADVESVAVVEDCASPPDLVLVTDEDPEDAEDAPDSAPWPSVPSTLAPLAQ